ncbi:PREDICTED: uncharacterized protein LOC104801561 [Tarenaya hassleriana]|uniref:uncharacterized protein LOC104801561 n=1 Tax=Tarenaya hassleriana TaxID=28532 RepID=UPI00053C91BB|nr:PREDICTED: uncharacterized protein LOC104801561 [Tarenaya hassleriana]
MDQGTGIGVGKPKRPKGRNQIKQTHKADKERIGVEQTSNGEHDFTHIQNGEFGDNSKLTRDWRKICGLLDVAVEEQEGDTCWAVVLSLLLEALVNKGKSPQLRLRFDTKQFIEDCRAKDSDRIGRIRTGAKYIRATGLPKKDVRSGASKHMVKRHLLVKEDANGDFIKQLLEKGPVALILSVSREFEDLKTKYEQERIG